MVRVEGSPYVQQLHMWQIFCTLAYDHLFLYIFTRVQVSKQYAQIIIYIYTHYVKKQGQ